MREQGNKGNRRKGEKGDKENRGTRETGEQRNRATRGTREQGDQRKRATRGTREWGTGQQRTRPTRAQGKQGKRATRGIKGTRGTGKQGNNSPSLTGQLSSLKQHTRACKRSDTCDRKQSRSTYTVSCNIKHIRRTLKQGPLQVKINSKTLVFL